MRIAWNDSTRQHRLTYADGVQLLIDEAGTRIEAFRPPGSSIEDVAVYVLGPAMGLLLHLRGVPCLHASAMVENGRAFAFTGPSGSGKSTAVGTFAREGRAVLTDDVLALHMRPDRVDAVPAYPRLRLWPPAAEALFGRDRNLPLITPGWDKRYLDLREPGFHFHPEPAILDIVYLLDHHDADSVEIARLPVRDAVVALASNIYAGRLLDARGRAQALGFMADLARNVSVRRLRRPWRMDALPAFRDAVLEDLAR